MNTMHLIDLRAVPNTDHHTWLRLNSGSLITLAPRVAAPHEAFDALPYHEQLLWRAKAFEKGAINAALVVKSAARLHGLWGIATKDEKSELAAASGNVPGHAKKNPNCTYRRMKLPKVFTVDGVRVCSRERSAIDIARFHGFADGVVAMDSFLLAGGTKKNLSDVLQVMGRVKAAGTARRAISAATAASESPYESLARALLIDEGLNPVPQVWVAPGIRVDLCIDGWLVIEIDGDIKYQDRDNTLAELKRQKKIENLGFRVLRFSPAELRTPEFLRMVRAALTAPPIKKPEAFHHEWRIPEDWAS